MLLPCTENAPFAGATAELQEQSFGEQDARSSVPDTQLVLASLLLRLRCGKMGKERRAPGATRVYPWLQVGVQEVPVLPRISTCRPQRVFLPRQSYKATLWVFHFAQLISIQNSHHTLLKLRDVLNMRPPQGKTFADNLSSNSGKNSPPLK